MGLASLLFSEPIVFLLLVIPLLYSIILHEVAHGVVALAFGDRTALNAGRLTLNPLPHIDPVGALLLFFVGFGWARPVPVNYGALRFTRVGIVLVALAGVTVNILLAAGALAMLRYPAVEARPYLAAFLTVMASVNLILGAFNLIPIPPLDGSKVLLGFLPQRYWGALARLEPFGFGLLLLLMLTGQLSPLIRMVRDILLAFLR